MKLHIYGQRAEHDDAFIIGDFEALTALREAIDRALNSPKAETVTPFTEDGEGYLLTVLHDGTSELMVPYTDNLDHTREYSGKPPWDLLKFNKETHKWEVK